MTHKQFFLSQFEREMPTTRKMLALVPEDKYDWQPHPKSYTLGTLAAHISTLTGFAIPMATSDKMDMSEWENTTITTTAELLSTFDDLYEKTKDAINTLSEEDFDTSWSMTAGEHTIMSMPKADVIQTVFMSHIIHHRAQLGMYLRLLDIAIPGTYGPSADEQ